MWTKPPVSCPMHGAGRLEGDQRALKVLCVIIRPAAAQAPDKPRARFQSPPCRQLPWRGAKLLDLFAADPKRAETLTFEAPHLLADFSKQRIDAPALNAMIALAGAADFDGWRAKLFNGDIVNTTENRAAKHWALRITDPPGGDNEVTAVLDRMHDFAQA